MENHDFDYSVLDERQHRPWPMPDRAWIMTQTWNDLLFAHWPIDKLRLASMIPEALELDLYAGEAWLGIVPFHMTNVAPRGVPALPRVSAFAELNVRTYVRVGDRVGVYFFSLDAASVIAVTAARAMFHLPYFAATMDVRRDEGRIRYRSRRNGVKTACAELIATYGPTGPSFTAKPGTLEYFLTERYCLFTVDADGRALELDIHHPPWLLHAAEATFEINTMAEAAGLRLPSRAPLLHFSKRQDVVAWPLEPCRAGGPSRQPYHAHP